MALNRSTFSAVRRRHGIRAAMSAHLPARVGVALRVHHEDVQVRATGEHVVQTAEADVVPAGSTRLGRLRAVKLMEQ